MPLPNLHILHPPESSLPGVTAWLGNLVGLFSTDANWDGCRVHRTEFDRQASFDVATVADLILKNPGPVVIIQSVQMRRVDHLRKMVGRKVTVHPPISASSEEDIWQVCEQVKQGYEDGDPRITLREAVAYLIVRKLCIQDKWAGCHGYLWAHDLANGGFPKDLVTSPRYVIDVAEALARAGILEPKRKEGKTKYGLTTAKIVQPILDNKSFEGNLQMQKFFRNDSVLVSVRCLDYNE